MQTLQPLRSTDTLVALLPSLWAPAFWIGVLFYGSRYDDYARQAITADFTDTLVLPGLALWGSGLVVTLTYWMVSKTVGTRCSFIWGGLALLLSAVLIYVVALCMMPQPYTDGWMYSLPQVTAQETGRAGLVAAGIIAGFALPGWIHYGGIRVNRAWEAQQSSL